jgi:hypothetical protein
MKASGMKATITNLILMLGLAAVNQIASAQETKRSSAIPPSVEEAMLVDITATVQEIDPKKRELTVKGPLGNVITFTVDERVERLGEIKVGDTIAAEYYVSIAGELRPATAEERLEPLTILEERAKAPKGTSPAAGGLRVIKAVTTVEGLDRPTRSVTLKGPRGNYATVRARDLNNLEKLRLGDTIVVTYTEALAVSVEKVPKKAKAD